MKITDRALIKRFAYPNYTNLIYRTLFGKTAKELEQEYGVKSKENLRDFFTGEDLAKVQSMEMLVSSLINCGWGYGQNKRIYSKRNFKNDCITTVPYWAVVILLPATIQVVADRETLTVERMEIWQKQ